MQISPMRHLSYLPEHSNAVKSRKDLVVCVDDDEHRSHIIIKRGGKTRFRYYIIPRGRLRFG